MTTLTLNAAAVAPAAKSGLFARIGTAIDAFFAATRVAGAIRGHNQPARRDLEILGIDPEHKFNL
ncbi:hypothetical protein V8J36_13725 [Frigidibacter sp. MR17.14]|uniref:hypothetical protein n=1 Tax=Frigidibacter sp. MR17.14 TaxID=3126509 RepID=UPI003012F4AF